MTSDQVETKELIRLEIQLPIEGWICIWGEVVYQVHEMGFTLRFTGPDDTVEIAINDHIRAKKV